MHAAVRTGARASVVLALALGTAGLLTPSAYAETATPPAVNTNWYWAEQAPAVNGSKLPVGPPAQSSGVADGDLGVGYVDDKLGTEDKSAAVAFDVGQIPLGATFSSFLLTVPYDPAANQLANGTPDISACELLDAFVAGAGPSPMSAEPPLSLPSCVKGTFKATIGTKGGYVFDLTAIANDWSGGAPANGVLLRATPGLATAQHPFTVSLQGKNGISTSATYTPAPVTVPTTAPAPAPAPGPVLPPAPPVTGGYVPPVFVPTGPGPVVATAPVPAPQVQPVTAPVVQALPYRAGALVPSGGWWLAFLGLLALLGLTAAVLGDPLAPTAVDPRRRRFAEAVRAQTRRPAPARPRHARSARPAPRIRPA